MESNDIQHGVEMAWHNLTVIKPSSQLAIDGFPFELEKLPVCVGGNEVPGWYWIAGNDDKKLIGNPQYSSFGFLSNTRFMDVVRETLKGTGATVASLGTFGSRAKRYVSIKVGSEWDSFRAGGREFSHFLNIQDALDGTMPLIAKSSNTCIVCANTFAASLGERSEFKLSLRHTSKHDSADKIANFQSAIDAFHGAGRLFKHLFDSAETVPVSEGKAQRIFAGFLGAGGEMATRSRNQVDRLTSLFNSGKGNTGRNGADLLSAATDYYSHESSGSRGAMAQFESSEVGSSGKRKVSFFESVSSYSLDDKGSRNTWELDPEKMGVLEKLGEKSLANS